MTVPKSEPVQTLPDQHAMFDRAKEVSGFLKALSHESRLLILCALAEGEKSVGELEELLAQRQATVSQQLARLRLDGLVTSRREGQMIYYSLGTEDVRAVLATLYEVFCRPKRRAGGHRRGDDRTRSRSGDRIRQG
ncbi:MAG: winged helix-turn-helix transcriptional regulator [Methylacidiphilales bacterium]|nr:winged helix-turn-helix transcriptional regulator [Candidatus Methylacidiphilales bacterium]